MTHLIEPQTSREPDTTSHLIETKLAVTVADIMTREVVTVSLHQSLADAISLIAIHQFHHLLVTDADRKLLGVISDRDLLRAVARTPNWQRCEISQVMTPDPVIVSPETPIFVAVSKVLSKTINCLPVVGDDGRVTGILTSTDLLRSHQKMVVSMKMRLQQIGLLEFSP